VGTATQSKPRNQEAAAKPAKSVTAPPPIATIKSERVNPAEPSQSQTLSSVSEFLPFSESGMPK
jgi:hypothetical protein